MSFGGSNPDGSENNKQRLNLSVQAYEVIQSDMFAFGEEKLSRFINCIFQYYYPEADASISRALNRLQGNLKQQLTEVRGDETTKRRVMDALLKQEEARLTEKARSYGKGKPVIFGLRKNNFEYLTKADSECAEEKFYDYRQGKYIKSVLEEYARLPYVQRERIYYTPRMEEIDHAIRAKCQLRVETGTRKVYSVYPYQVLCDPLSTANYLVGYSRRYSYPEDGLRPCSYRISALADVKAEKSKSAFLKQDRRKQLEQSIASRGVQFMASEEEEIHVRLTETGKDKYQRQVHLRPTRVREQEDVFVFQCTAAQAEFYFFKFGADAEIILPVSLREKLKSMYEQAASAYESN